MARALRVPAHAEWVITAELVDQNGVVLGRTVPLRWAVSFVRGAHPSASGQAITVFLDDMLSRILSPSRGRR